MLHEHHGIAPMIIIDEYDTPIHEGYSQNFYDDVISFMHNFFSGAFKDNRHLTYGFMTGILRIAQESIFSGLNNLTVNSVFDQNYSEFFGFTATEISDMLHYYHHEENQAQLTEWYDGYHFGNIDIYNPWSAVSIWISNHF